MKKRLFTVLQTCHNEEEVKSKFAKYFGLPMVTHKCRIDLYTEQALYEFKYDKDFNKVKSRAKVIAQTLYYIRILKLGKSYDQVPSVIVIACKTNGFIVNTTSFHDFYNASVKYDWDRSPSQPDPVLVDALTASKQISDIHVYDFSNEQEENLFVDQIYALAQKKLLCTDKKEINESNFEEVFAYWNQLFEKYVENGHKSSEYFISDIESGRSQIIGDTEVLFRLGDGTVSKSVLMSEYLRFWDMYDKVDNPNTIKSIRHKIDRLSKDFNRRFTGEFYTPIDFASKAYEYIERTVGKEKFKKGNWRIWDMAAGTGNLEYLLPSQIMDHCYISTLVEDEANYCKRIFPTATVFQYDYLKDDAHLIENPNMKALFTPHKMPQNLYDDLHNPEISWIIFINPPFATANKASKKTGKDSKTNVSMTPIQQLMTNADYGETSRELFSQFLYRISIEFKGKRAYLGMFSKIKYLNATNDQKMRDGFFQYKFERGFIFPSKAFVGTQGNFPVGFLVWDLSEKKHLSKQQITLDVYNLDCEKIGLKTIPIKNKEEFLNNWFERPKCSLVFPPFKSGWTLGKDNTDKRDRIARDFICSVMSCGSDMQHQNQTAIFSGPQTSAGSFSVTPPIFEHSMVLHAVRLLPTHYWHNDRDQFYRPNTDKLSQDLIADCVIWSAFASSNNTVALKDIEYKGKIYQIHNEMFPFLLSETRNWNCGLKDITAQMLAQNEDRFLAKWISEHDISPEAQAVLDIAKQLYMTVYANLNKIRWPDYKISLWDIGWYQIKKAAKDIQETEPILKELKENSQILANKILPQITALGFLPPDIEYI